MSLQPLKMYTCEVPNLRIKRELRCWTRAPCQWLRAKPSFPLWCGLCFPSTFILPFNGLSLLALKSASFIGTDPIINHCWKLLGRILEEGFGRIYYRAPKETWPLSLRRWVFKRLQLVHCSQFRFSVSFSLQGKHCVSEMDVKSELKCSGLKLGLLPSRSPLSQPVEYCLGYDCICLWIFTDSG